jgi:hypothetical protein
MRALGSKPVRTRSNLGSIGAALFHMHECSGCKKGVAVGNMLGLGEGCKRGSTTEFARNFSRVTGRMLAGFQIRYPWSFGGAMEPPTWAEVMLSFEIDGEVA